ncbi:pentapeptide repeat-containing protein [Flavobacterium lacustre]|uniref:pentapeptide repeat-containing protein n=1 Tax=Flavobacterium lacustre TaxID=3016339 RepID=UPI0022B6B694|nr:pentapeptide repeat-containing protein [Flavobacterium lacustre]
MAENDQNKNGSSNGLNEEKSYYVENRIMSLNLKTNDPKDEIAIKKLRIKIAESEENLISSGKIEKKDIKFFSSNPEYISKKRYFSIENFQYINYLFTRAVATDFIFRNIDFSKTIFDNCYLRDCLFINCKFEGAKFMNCNLQGSYFELCNFDYVTFEKTFVDDEIFECAPKKDNLKYKFARSLKLNYASIGDYIKASKAVTIELEATKSHLKDSWLSGEEWYNLKYGGIKRRSEQFWKWFKVSALDFVWGNGESLWRLIRFNLLIFALLTFYHIVEKSIKNTFQIINIFIIKIPSNYFGITIIDSNSKDYFEYYPAWLSLILVITRLICFGLLMSIIIKKYNRR